MNKLIFYMNKPQGMLCQNLSTYLFNLYKYFLGAILKIV